MKRRLVSLSAGTLCTLLLGMVSALTFALLGPAVKILSDPQRTLPIPLSELFGPRIATFLSHFLGREQYSATELWAQLPILIVAAAFFRAGLGIAQWFLWERSSELVARDMRQDLVESYLKLQPEARRLEDGLIDREIAAGVGNDIRMVREYLVHFFGGFPRELVQVILYLVTLFLLEPSLASFFLLGLGPTGILLARLGKKMRKRSQKVLDNSSLLVEWLQQRLSGIETIKQFQTEYLEARHLNHLSHNLFGLYVKAARVKARTSPLLEIIAIAAMMLVLGYALQKIAAGELNSSVLISFFAILGNLSQSASKLGRYFNSNKEGEAALHRLENIQSLMKSSAQIERKLSLKPDQELSLELNSVSYRYQADNFDSYALKDISLKLEKGRIYAIAGPSGSGKSTLVKLILGLWKLQVGTISYGLTHPSGLGYLPQSIQLNPGSIAANVCYPDLEYDLPRLKDALLRVDLYTFIESLPQSWQTEVGEGLTLSGGQAQRIQMARLIYHRFPLVIIDEGTSALDPETEATVFKSLREMAGAGTTLVLVAHRMAALKIADELIVLKRGHLFYRGEPQGILKDSSWRELFDGDA